MCLNKELYARSTIAYCHDDDWLYNSDSWQWTFSPNADSSYDNCVFYVSNSGYVSNDYAYYAGPVRPSVYLLSSTKILSGEGTPENPYMIG